MDLVDRTQRAVQPITRSGPQPSTPGSGYNQHSARLSTDDSYGYLARQRRIEGDDVDWFKSMQLNVVLHSRYTLQVVTCK